MIFYPAGSKVTFGGVLMTNGKARLQANNPLRSIDLDLADFEPLTVTPPTVEINDIVSLNGTAYEGMTFKLIGVDGDRAWVRNRDTGLRTTIDYKDVNFVARKSAGE